VNNAIESMLAARKLGHGRARTLLRSFFG